MLGPSLIVVGAHNTLRSLLALFVSPISSITLRIVVCFKSDGRGNSSRRFLDQLGQERYSILRFLYSLAGATMQVYDTAEWFTGRLYSMIDDYIEYITDCQKVGD